MDLTGEIKKYLVSEGWDNSGFPYQYHTDDYYIVELEKDSYGFCMYSIINKRYSETMFKGRILSIRQLISILSFVKEDYNLTEGEIFELNEMKNYIDKIDKY